mgnify:CR=1 FL=1
MPSFETGPVSGSAPTQIDVDTASKEVVAENYSRVGLVLMNLSTGTVYLGFGTNAAVVGSGIPLLPSGGNWSMDDYTYTKEAINAIAHSNNSLLAIQEFVNRA